MAEEFLTTAELETVAATVKVEKKTRKRGPMSAEQKERIKASHAARRERLQAQAVPNVETTSSDAGTVTTVNGAQLKAQAVPNVETGITAEDAEEMRQELRLKAAEARIKEAAISEDNRLMIHQEIRVDVFNLKRQYVELTPSMCRSRNCPFDAAREAGATAWGDSPIDQTMSDGKTFGDRLIALREYHEATAHTVQQLNDHILTAGELQQRQWGVGQNIKSDFLQGAK